MLDYQRILDDVHNSLYTAGEDGLDSLRAAAADYRAACEEVNERLRRCDDCLRRGLRSEAIQMADVEPVLLDVVAMLDFSDRQHWTQLLAQHGIAAGPPLALDLAAELNEAYAHERPLAGLLAQHRLLALAHSPLKARIQVLRQLAGLDTANPVWREDLSTYERERQRQLHKEVTAASEAGNLGLLTSLGDELRGDPWLEPPPQGLLTRAAEALTRVARGSARQKMEQIAASLAEAHCQHDLESARELRRRWRAVSAVARLPAEDALVRQVAPTLDWLNQQDRLEAAESARRQSIAALQSALAHSADRRNLERRFQAATADGQELPPELEQQYHARLAAIDRSAARRRRWMIAGGLLALVVTAGGIAAAVYYTLEAAQLAADASALARLLDEGQLDEAQQMADRLAKTMPTRAADPRIANLVVRLAELKRQDVGRRAALEADLRAAIAGGLDHPDLAALKHAETLVRSEADRTTLLTVQGQIDAERAKRQQEQEAAFRKSLAELRQRVVALSSDHSSSPAAQQATIDLLRSQLTALAADTGDDIRPEVLEEIKPLAAQLESRATSARRQSDEDSGEMAITRAVGDSAAFRQAMQSYVDRFRDAPRTAGFARTLAETKLWNEVDDWNALAATWGSVVPAALDPKRAGQMAAAIKAFCGKYPGWPGNAALLQRVSYLDAVAQRMQDDQPLVAGLQRLFSDPLMADVWLVELKDHKRYYSRIAPDAGAGLVRFKYVAGFDLSEKARNIKAGDVLPARRAPQVALSEKALQILAGLNDGNWDATFQHLIEEIWKSDAKGPRIDPLLKLKLLQQTVDVATRGSSVLASELAQQVKMLHSSKVSPIANWLEPDDAEANTSREQAVRELDLVAKVPPATEGAKERTAQARTPLGKQFHWMGWLRRGTDGTWQCAGNLPENQSGKLCVMVPNGDKETLHVIGHLTPQGARITATGPAMLEGRPIYIVAQPDEA